MLLLNSSLPEGHQIITVRNGRVHHILNFAVEIANLKLVSIRSRVDHLCRTTISHT
jgi:hypothetical protein